MRASIMAGVVATGLLFSATVTLAQVSDKPFQENWAPSKWGKDDAAGSSNHTRNPENIKRALSMIKQYKSVTLGKYYHREIPTVGLRQWSMVLPGTPNAGPFGENAMVYHDELVTTEIGQIGTQFDGPGHIGVNTSKGMFLYNGRMYPESYERGPAGRAGGMGPNGVENVGELGFICRGIVLDAAGYKGVDHLPIPQKPGDPGTSFAVWWAVVDPLVQRRGAKRVPCGIITSSGSCTTLLAIRQHCLSRGAKMSPVSAVEKCGFHIVAAESSFSTFESSS